MSSGWPRCFCALSICFLLSNVAIGQITFGTLTDEVGDRDALAIHPNGSYSQLQASSHDPRNGTALGSQLGGAWGFKNVDFGNFIRIDPNNELVLFEDSGPGAISRWWLTGNGHNLLAGNNFRVYLDGSTTPAIEATGRELFGSSGLWEGDTQADPTELGFGDSLNFETPLWGGNIYGPITYNSGVKVTWDGPTTHGNSANILDYVNNEGGNEHSRDSALWYVINYRKYAPGTNIQSYTSSDSTTYATELGAANTRLTSNTVEGHVGTTDTVTGQSLTAGAALTRSYNAGGGTNGKAIREITLDFNGANTADHAAALAGTFVELTFDGQLTARVPVEQFFGNGWSNSSGSPYNTAGGTENSDHYRSVKSDGTLSTRWVMPFQNDAEVRIINNSNQVVDVDLTVKTGDFTWSDNAMHFHANYREENGIRTRGAGFPGTVSGNDGYSAEGDADFRFLNVRGKGVYVGDSLSVRNPNGGWWGEGDEKVYVDYIDPNGDGSDTTPTHVGTGSEDYYGYSFSRAELFTTPFVTQPTSGAHGGAGDVAVNSRVRGLDAIPFEESFKFDLELWKWGAGTVDQGAATFWYGRPGAVALNAVANLANDFKAAQSNGDPASGIEDTSGEGSWNYYSSDNADLSTPGVDMQLLTWGNVGNAGNQGFGGGENGSNNLSAISDDFLFTDGTANIGIEGELGYQELAFHPGGDGFAGNSDREYVVAQWVAGDSIDGLINIGGSVRNFVGNGDSIDFYIYVDGQLEFSANGSGSILDETPFDFDAMIAPGETVEFVIGNGAGSNPFGDEALLRAEISADFFTPIELFGDMNGDGVLNSADWTIFRNNFGTSVGDLNDDGISDYLDFGLFKDAYTGVNGAQAFADLLSVPEPSTLALSGILLGLLCSGRGKLRSP